MSRYPPFEGLFTPVRTPRIMRGSVQCSPVPHNGGPNGCMCCVMTQPVGLEATRSYADVIVATYTRHRHNTPSHHPVSVARCHVTVARALVQNSSDPVRTYLEASSTTHYSCVCARTRTQYRLKYRMYCYTRTKVAKLSPMLRLSPKLALASLVPSLELLQQVEERPEHLQDLLEQVLLRQRHPAPTWKSSESSMFRSFSVELPLL